MPGLQDLTKWRNRGSKPIRPEPTSIPSAGTERFEKKGRLKLKGYGLHLLILSAVVFGLLNLGWVGWRQWLAIFGSLFLATEIFARALAHAIIGIFGYISAVQAAKDEENRKR